MNGESVLRARAGVTEAVETGVARAGGGRTRRELESARATEQAIQLQRDREARRQINAQQQEAGRQETRRAIESQIEDNRRNLERWQNVPRSEEVDDYLAHLRGFTAMLTERLVRPNLTQEQEDRIYDSFYNLARRQMTPLSIEDQTTQRESYRGQATEDGLTERETPEAEPEAVTEREDYGDVMQQDNLLRFRADLARSNAQSNLNTRLANGFNTSGLRDV